MKIIMRWTILLLLGFSSVLAVYGVHLFRRENALFERDAKSDLRRIGLVLRMQLMDMLNGARPEEFKDLIRDAELALPNLAVSWVDISRASAQLSSDERSRLLRGAEILHTAGRFSEKGVTVLYLPVLSPRYPPLAIRLSQPNLEPVRYTKATLLSILIATFAVLLVSVLLVFTLSHHMVGKPMERIIDRFKRISDDDLSLTSVKRKDEFGGLERAINDMCGKLASSQERERRETEARIAAVEQARQTDRMATVGRLASGVAHELGTPLNVVSGMATGIARGEYEPHEIPATAATIAAQARRMTRIVHDVLSFVRRHRPSAEEMDLREVVAAAVDLLKPLVRKSGVSVELCPGPQCMVEADRDHMTQVLVNLVQNAIQAQPAGGAVELSLAPVKACCPTDPAAVERPWVRLTVKDHGPGMPPEVQEQIFDPFFTTKDVGEGTGLGLSVVHGIVEEHNGWITVDSVPGQGSRFSIYLPDAAISEGTGSLGDG